MEDRRAARDEGILGDSLVDFLQGQSQLEPCEMGAETAMRTGAEPDVAVGMPFDL